MPTNESTTVKKVYVNILIIIILAFASTALVIPYQKNFTQPTFTYLRNQGPILSSGVLTTKDIVYTASTVPSSNGSIVEGGIRPITAVLKEAGTSWGYVLEITVSLTPMDNYTAMNKVTGVQVGKLPGSFMIKKEDIAAIQDS
ncbi:translation initiation inhibitor [Lindgomyces ingoldianus]|uniref:Translation initiation inhibitor n=1 Tax=Lindgomyces ingoldianus TaxID=673940 RepID=A0ACB6RGH6_9PLEO|nr:translation initiation inhibitor [Lindgomyces ingoldianus]KAF2478226.1 translation initiation inhibitor [Lindgomyces ingoldianus]